ncbi:type 4b pilus protein PilO2 [Chitinimonas koreensis]|uniref:type 4b pilus protein PilO2 n=1 Tax=Chitinimonas koreensis TaxID=356302 RepID=UPI001654A08D|nr:type 4b pilus protein PilO2 [Chitinimonas koreensis]QNM95519.1 type 4b pilus protein PilO2 [Chitinimonas koreensis]
MRIGAKGAQLEAVAPALERNGTAAVSALAVVANAFNSGAVVVIRVLDGGEAWLAVLAHGLPAFDADQIVAIDDLAAALRQPVSVLQPPVIWLDGQLDVDQLGLPATAAVRSLRLAQLLTPRRIRAATLHSVTAPAVSRGLLKPPMLIALGVLGVAGWIRWSDHQAELELERQRAELAAQAQAQAAQASPERAALDGLTQVLQDYQGARAFIDTVVGMTDVVPVQSGGWRLTDVACTAAPAECRYRYRRLSYADAEPQLGPGISELLELRTVGDRQFRQPLATRPTGLPAGTTWSAVAKAFPADRLPQLVAAFDSLLDGGLSAGAPATPTQLASVPASPTTVALRSDWTVEGGLHLVDLVRDGLPPGALVRAMSIGLGSGVRGAETFKVDGALILVPPPAAPAPALPQPNPIPSGAQS